MRKKARLGLYLEDERIKRMVKIAAARRGVSATAYCAQAIEERLKREGELTDEETRKRLALIARMDQLRKEIGTVGKSVADLVEEGRRR